jgi:hypothetical protein
MRGFPVYGMQGPANFCLHQEQAVTREEHRG